MNSAKHLRVVFLVLVTLWLSAPASAQCTAFFNDSISGTSVSFFNGSTASVGSFFYWSFPGGTPNADTTTSLGQVPTTTYGAPGPYTVCLTVFDSANSCVDTSCLSVFIPGNPLTVGFTSQNSACSACIGSISSFPANGIPPYSYVWSTGETTSSIFGLCVGSYSLTVMDSNGDTAFLSTNIIDTFTLAANTTPSSVNLCPGDSGQVCANATNGNPPFSYLWSTGETTQCILVNASSPGMYNVTVSDTTGCSATASSIVFVDSSLALSTSFTNETCAGCCDGTASASATGGAPNYAYLWNTGANTDSISSLCPGTYSVTVSDSNACTEIGQINILSACQNSISGLSNLATASTAFLIQESGGVLSLVDSIDFDSIFAFNGLCPGTYYTKVALRPTSNFFSSYLPTYFNYQVIWANATALVASGNSQTNINVTMVPGINSGGPGFIAGLISQGANRAEGDPIPDADVILVNSNDEAVEATKSDIDGRYSFDNLPLGEYKVYVDRINFAPFPHTVVLSAEDPEAESRDFELGSGIARPVDLLGIYSLDAGSHILLYPNPASEHIVVEGEGISEVSLINLMGQQVMNVTPNAGQSRMHINLSDLPSGNYIVRTVSNSGTAHNSLIKQ